MSAAMAPAPVVMMADARSGSRWRQIDPAAPQLVVTDLGVTRGEGVFETVGVFDARPASLEGHLDRLERSAAMLDMAPIDREGIRSALHRAVAAHVPMPELAARILVTPGLEGADRADPGAATSWVHVSRASDYAAERAGLRVVTLDRGISTSAPRTSPWLLAGAKSLSYAVNMAALREAGRRGAQDVLFVSSDGYALEGPTSTLLVHREGRFLTTPAAAGVLPGTSSDAVLAAVGASASGEELLRPEEVAAADGAWLLSSVRLAAPITHLDGAELPQDPQLTERLNRIIRDA